MAKKDFAMRLRKQAAIIVFFVLLGYAVRIDNPLMILPMFFFPPLFVYLQALPYVLPILTLWTLLLIAVYLRRVWRKDASDTRPVYRWAVSVAAMALAGTIVAPYAMHAIYPTYRIQTHTEIEKPTTIVFENSFDYETCRSFCFMLEDFGVSTLVFASSRGIEYTWTLRNDVCIDQEKNPMSCWAPRDRLTETERAEAYIFRISNPQRRTDGHDRVVQELTVSQNASLLLTVTNTESNIRELVFGQSPHLWRRVRGMDFGGVQENQTTGYLRKERSNPQRPYTRNFFAFENQGLHHYALSTLGLLDERSEGFDTPENRAFRREMEERLGRPRMTYDRFVGLLGELDYDGVINLLNMYASRAGQQSHRMYFLPNQQVCIKEWVESQRWYNADVFQFHLGPNLLKSEKAACTQAIDLVYSPQRMDLFMQRAQDIYQKHVEHKNTKQPSFP